MGTSRTVLAKITRYDPKCGLDHTARFFLALCEVNHDSTKGHVERVALLAEATAKALKMDAKAAFFAGILHDLGKIVLPASMFDGHNVDAAEYEQIKAHALNAFKILKKFHMFIALCAGLHHNLYKAGYGITPSMFPKEWSMATIMKVLNISVIVSICDFVDAYTHRTTTIKGGSCQGTTKQDLMGILYDKYPHEHLIVNAVLKVNKKEF
jgi:hypothetical protein